MSLSYTTAKLLKDSGFPQKNIETYALPDGRFLGDNQIELSEIEGSCKIPSLGELLDSCSWEFQALYFLPDEKVNKWFSQGRKTPERFGGSSPEEAVAALWLSINKK